MIEFRWLEPAEIEQFVNPTCQQQGWAQLNISETTPTCRVLGAFDGVRLVGFMAVQLHPVIGPAYVDPDHRDGTISRELADQVHAFLTEAKCRGALLVADSAASARLATRHGMERVQSPVFLWVGE